MKTSTNEIKQSVINMCKTMDKCSKTGKYTYTSESKANRAKNKYPDIRRYYYCDHCEGWHTTKIGISLAVSEGILDRPKKRKKKSINPQQIQSRMNQLKKKTPKK